MSTNAAFWPHAFKALVTGFGPFPGVPVNASAHLVRMIEQHFSQAKAGEAMDGAAMAGEVKTGGIVTQILPTEWEGAKRKLEQVVQRHAPDFTVHFGVSDKAPGFVLEHRARNRVCAHPDALGQCCPPGQIRKKGPDALFTAFNLEAMQARLSAQGLAVKISADAGEYVCNYLYDSALHLAAGAQRPYFPLFVHIPDFTRPGGCLLTKETALEGALEILDLCAAQTAVMRDSKKHGTKFVET